MSLYELIAPTYSQMLKTLEGLLAKGESWAGENGVSPADLLDARLAPDMFPLLTQIRFCCIQAGEVVDRLSGNEPAETREISDLAEGRTLISETLVRLAELDPAALESAETRKIVLSLQNGMVFEMTGFQYVRDWALPQFYFHIMTAYAILRQLGVTLGKADYVPHALAYLKQPA